MSFKFTVLKKLPETPNETFKKAMNVFTNLEVGTKTTVEKVDPSLFKCYLASITKLKPINGRFRKTFITKKINKSAISVFCTSDQAIFKYNYEK